MRIAGQPGLGLRQDARQELAGVAPRRLEDGRRVARSLEQGERPRVQRSPRPDPLEVPAVRAVGTRAGPTVDLDPIARFDRWVSRQGRRETEAGWPGFERPQRCDLLAVTRRPDRLDDHRPRPVAARCARELGRHGRDHPAERDGQHADDKGEECSSLTPEDRRDDQPDRDQRQRGGDEPSIVTRDRERPDDSAARDPRAPRHQPAVTRGRSFSNVFSPSTPRERSSSTAPNAASSRAAMIFWAVAGPTPGSSSSWAWSPY